MDLMKNGGRDEVLAADRSHVFESFYEDPECGLNNSMDGINIYRRPDLKMKELK